MMIKTTCNVLINKGSNFLSIKLQKQTQCSHESVLTFYPIFSFSYNIVTGANAF